MKKTYMRPEGTVIQLCMEHTFLTVRLRLTLQRPTPTPRTMWSLNRPAKGWGSESWSEE